jgi:hypothetical protein
MASPLATLPSDELLARLRALVRRDNATDPERSSERGGIDGGSWGGGAAPRSDSYIATGFKTSSRRRDSPGRKKREDAAAGRSRIHREPGFPSWVSRSMSPRRVSCSLG